MDTDKIIQDLNRRFAAPLPEFYQRCIIFWYDEDKTLAEVQQIYDLNLVLFYLYPCCIISLLYFLHK